VLASGSPPARPASAQTRVCPVLYVRERQTDPLWFRYFGTHLSAGGQPIIGFSRLVLVSPRGLDGPGSTLIGSFDSIEATLYSAGGCICRSFIGRHNCGLWPMEGSVLIGWTMTLTIKYITKRFNFVIIARSYGRRHWCVSSELLGDLNLRRQSQGRRLIDYLHRKGDQELKGIASGQIPPRPPGGWRPALPHGRMNGYVDGTGSDSAGPNDSFTLCEEQMYLHWTLRSAGEGYVNPWSLDRGGASTPSLSSNIELIETKDATNYQPPKVPLLGSHNWRRWYSCESQNRLRISRLPKFDSFFGLSPLSPWYVISPGRHDHH